MSYFFKTTLCCALLIIVAVSPAFADDGQPQEKPIALTIGAGVAGATSEYKGVDDTVRPFPLINIESRYFYLRNMTAGFNVFKDDMHEFSVTLGWLPQEYKAKNSDNWSMRQLDNRHSTALAGLAYSLTTEYGIAAASIQGDILGKSDGFIGDVSYAYPVEAGALTVVPSAGVLWTSEDHNDYYYGVSGKESRESGLSKYSADGGFSPYLGLDASFALTEQWELFVNGKATFLSEEIKDSPMVNEDVKYTFGAGIGYSF